MVDGDGRPGRQRVLCHMTSNPLKPASTAITAGRGASGSSLAPAAVGVERVGVDVHGRRQPSAPRRCAPASSTGATPTRRCARSRRRSPSSRVPRRRWRSRSGMGAIASRPCSRCARRATTSSPPRQLYAGTLAFLQGPCARFGIETTLVDGTQPGAFAAAVQPGRTTLVLAETPSNPRLELCDLDEIGAITGPFTVVDSTFATPLGQQPLAHGVDLVLHSATKGIAGHNDATLGVVAGERELLEAIWSTACCTARRRHRSTPSTPCAACARWRCAPPTRRPPPSGWPSGSSSIPRVSAVHYPGLASHPQHDLAKRQMRQFGTVLAFDLAGGQRGGAAPVRHDAVGALRDVARRTRDAGVPPDDDHPCQPHARGAAELRASRQGLVRMSVGLEDPTTSSPTSSARWPSTRVSPTARRPRRSAARRGRTRTSSTALRRSAACDQSYPRPARGVRRPRREPDELVLRDPSQLDRVTVARDRRLSCRRRT